MAYIRIYLNNVLLDQVELNEDNLTIGRDPKSDIVLDNAGVSSQHAVIEKNHGLFVITDNDSKNGVFVNGEKTDQRTLKYRDEIQIYNYLLKFMAVAGLQEEADPDIAKDGKLEQTGTMEVDVSDVQDLLKLREQKKEAYVELLNAKSSQTRYSFDRTDIKIGRSRTCDIHTSGWFSPRLAAEIQRRKDGYYLMPGKRGRVERNGQPLKEPIKLEDGDFLRVRNLSMTFFHRKIVTQ